MASYVEPLPAAIQSIIDALPDTDEQFAAEMMLLGAGEFQRSHPLVAAAQELAEAEVYDFWRLCAAL